MEEITHSEHIEHDQPHPAASHPEHASDADQAMPQKPRKKWYKSFWFWLVIVMIVIIGALVAWYWTARSKELAKQAEKSQAEEQVASDWRKIVEATAKTTTAVKTAGDANELRDATEQIAETASAANAAKFDINDHQTDADEVFTTALDSLLDYLGALQLIAQDVEAAEEKNFTEAETIGKRATRDVSRFVDSADFIDEQPSADFFILHATMKKIFDEIVEAKKSEEDAQKAEEAEAKKIAADEKAVRTTTADFAEAYINGDETAIRKVMSAAFQSEFDFDQLKPENRTISRPLSFRVTELTRASDSKYFVYGRLTQEIVGTSEQFTYDQNYTVILDGGKWLIDVDNAPTT